MFTKSRRKLQSFITIYYSNYRVLMLHIFQNIHKDPEIYSFIPRYICRGKLRLQTNLFFLCYLKPNITKFPFTECDTSNSEHPSMWQITEALRVRQFHAQCEAVAVSTEDVLVSLGRLMLASHESLRDLYECSHPQLDKLVDLSRGIAYGKHDDLNLCHSILRKIC